MTGITMFDSVSTGLLPAGYSYAAYIDGGYRNYALVREMFPGADVLSIAVFAADDADCLDIEREDATPQQAPGWTARQHARGISRPCLYASVSAMGQVLGELSGADISRSRVRLWSAHYGQGQHICGPSSCAQAGIAMDGTQWTDTAGGVSLDQSLLAYGFFHDDPGHLSLAETEAIMNVLPVLSQGSKDDSGQWPVHRMQVLVSALGKWHDLGPAAQIVADGDFGPRTKAALELAQGFLKLAPDGVCGAKTWAGLVTG